MPRTSNCEGERLSYLQCPNGGEACAESQKLYLNGNRAKDVFTLKGPSSELTDCEGPATCTTSYEYGPRENIVFEQALWRNPGSGGETNTWDYDDAMNVRDDSVHGNGHHYEYDGNRLKWIEQNTQIQSKYFYDVDGNLDCVTGTNGAQSDCNAAFGGPVGQSLVESYKWDFLGRLESFRRYDSGTQTDSATYTHDPLDRLVREVETHGQTTRNNCFTYLGLSGAVSEEKLVPATCNDSPTKTKSYAYGPDLERTSLNVQGTQNDDGDYFYARNVHGDVSLLLKSDGARKGSYGYLPYGEADSGLTGEQQSSEPPGLPFNPYRFNDRRVDSGSASTDMGARRYSSTLGRFIQQDSYPGAEADLGLGLDPLNMNRYVFAGGNPTNFFDLNGHEGYKGSTGWFRKHRARGSVSWQVSSGGSSSAGGERDPVRSSPDPHFPVLYACRDNRQATAPAEEGICSLTDSYQQHERGAGKVLGNLALDLAPGTGNARALNACQEHFGFTLDCVASIPLPGSTVVRGTKTGVREYRALEKTARDSRAAKEAAEAGDELLDVAATRVKLRIATKAEIRANAPKTASGDFIDPNTGQVIPRGGPFHYGHKPGYEWWRTQQMAREQGWTREQLIEYENDPSHFQIEDPLANLSHRFERPR